MKRTLFFFIVIFLSQLNAQNFVDFVNPFMGTGGHGHAFPGATLPFGMVQLSPDQRTQGWDWCSGYHYSDSTIKGFSHTHLSGTGASDLGDILFMPYTGPITFNEGGLNSPEKGYRSTFSHDEEIAEPGYYRVFLQDDQIMAELTATYRCGFHRYTFSQAAERRIIIDLEHGISDTPIETGIKIVDSVTIEGYRISSGWAEDHTIHFYARFSVPFLSWMIAEDEREIGQKNEYKGTKSKIVLTFKSKNAQPLLIKVGISPVDMEGAKNNLESEIPHWNFDLVREQARTIWNKMLSRVSIKHSDKNALIKFYSSLYHALIHPSLFSDVDGRYVGMDGKIHRSDEPYYTIFSLWDTYRAAHSFYQFIYPEYNESFVKAMLKKYQEFGQLPMWELHSNETYCMTGNHSIPVVAEFMLYGNNNENLLKLAEEAVIRTGFLNERDMDDYRKYGFVPSDRGADAVTKTLEYAYDDYCVAQLLKHSRDYPTADVFLARSFSYRNLFEKGSGFFRGKNQNGAWITPFDPVKPSGWGTSDYTEGNAWQYLWYVPHNLTDLINLLGGPDAFEKKLDQFFTTHFTNDYYIPSDISGLIGMYAHGNEPVHHVLYLYSFIGKPWKGQMLIRQVMDSLYRNDVEGYPGNEDCGQMSAWFLFSSLGFYSVDPVSPHYIIGTPLFDEVILQLEQDKTLTLRAVRKTKEDKYISHISWNGKDYPYTYFDKRELWEGSVIEFFMSSEPNPDWGEEQRFRPYASVNKPENIKFPEPIYRPKEVSNQHSFLNKKRIQFECKTPGTMILFSETADLTKWSKYEKPFMIHSSGGYFIKALKDGRESDVTYLHFQREIFKENAEQEYPKWIKKPIYSSKYHAGGDYALMDGRFGSERFADGKWQGIQGNDLDVIIDLGRSFSLDSINIRFLKNHASWIFLPENVEIYIGEDQSNLSRVYQVELEVPDHYEPDEIRKILSSVSRKQVRYVRVIAKNPAVCPDWHSGAGHKAWMFVDEISIVPGVEEKVEWEEN